MGGEALLALLDGKAEMRKQKSEIDEPLAGNGHGREDRFSKSSLTRSKIKRDGLKAGTPAPDFRLPRLDGRGDLSLSELRGRRVLLVFSSPGCDPCNILAPELEKLHREHPELELIMISKGEPKENRAKVKEHGLTFPIVLQQQWEISRRYAMFATPIGYLIGENGIIAHDVALGSEPILELANTAVPALHLNEGIVSR
jgi:peroxiredoxin